jgi:hypothetical protein
MRTAPLITTIPTQPGGQIFESGDATTRGTLTEKDPTSTPAKVAHNWRTRSMRGAGTLQSLARRGCLRGAPVEDPHTGLLGTACADTSARTAA